MRIELEDAHRHSLMNKYEIKKSKNCTCFTCLKTFPSSEVILWCDDEDSFIEETGICPYCDVDSVIGDAAGYGIDVMINLRGYWMKRRIA
ncbi:MAG: cytoplasmic protein [Ghiorsea sp.]